MPSCLVGSVLIDINEERTGMGFIDAGSLKAVERGGELPAEIPQDVAEAARACAAAAVEEKLGRVA